MAAKDAGRGGTRNHVAVGRDTGTRGLACRTGERWSPESCPQRFRCLQLQLGTWIRSSGRERATQVQVILLIISVHPFIISIIYNGVGQGMLGIPVKFRVESSIIKAKLQFPLNIVRTSVFKYKSHEFSSKNHQFSSKTINFHMKYESSIFKLHLMGFEYCL